MVTFEGSPLEWVGDSRKLRGYPLWGEPVSNERIQSSHPPVVVKELLGRTDPIW